MRNNKSRSLFTIHCSLFYILLATCYLLLATFLVACGRRGDPVAIMPYKEVPVVKNLRVEMRDEAVLLIWGVPQDKNFPEEAPKGFVIFRAEIPEGVIIEECECDFRSLDFISSGGQMTFEYIDKKAIKGQSYIYKLVVMDKDNMMGKDSNIVLLKGVKSETEEVITRPEAPTGLVAVYAQKSVVLTWDGIKGQEIKFYRVYRSEGKEFVVIGESPTFAFTDRNIEKSKKYYYRVTAVGEIEGSPSVEIKIVIENYQR